MPVNTALFPLFFCTTPTGLVTTLINAALTNTPALDGMDEAMLAAASLLAATSTEDTTMDELLEQLRWFLGLPLSATKRMFSPSCRSSLTKSRQLTASRCGSCLD
jgi:phage I-like protein